jgi:hypothetical protein
MKRFRLSTLMLLIVIAALCVALVVQHRRSIRIEAELRARLAESWPLFLRQQVPEEQMRLFIERRQQKFYKDLAKPSEAEAQRDQSKRRESKKEIEDE